MEHQRSGDEREGTNQYSSIAGFSHTNTNVGTSANPNLNVETSTNPIMISTQQVQGQGQRFPTGNGYTQQVEGQGFPIGNAYTDQMQAQGFLIGSGYTDQMQGQGQGFPTGNGYGGFEYGYYGYETGNPSLACSGYGGYGYGYYGYETGNPSLACNGYGGYDYGYYGYESGNPSLASNGYGGYDYGYYGYETGNPSLASNGYDGYDYGYYGYESGNPSFASNFANNPTQYAVVVPPQQIAANGYAAVNMNGYNGYNYYNNNGYIYKLPSAERARPQPQSNHLQTQPLRPAGRFNFRRNGPVGAGSMQTRRPATSTTTDIIDQNICIGPRYMRISGQRALNGSGAEREATHDLPYNLPAFSTRYENAKFFVMKTCSKRHVLNSIIHGMWTSTLRGNQALNAAYDEAQGVDSGCPLFLLFSINGTRNFCGVAEMVGPVDFEATTEFWNSSGNFPVKWHIIKDVPFTEVCHITLESNGNQSIIYSQEFQQVEIEKGEAMLDIFKNYVLTTSLLDELTLRQESGVGLLLRRPTSVTPQREEEQHQEDAVDKEEKEESGRKEEGCQETGEKQEEVGDEEEKEESQGKEEEATVKRAEGEDSENESTESSVCINSTSENNSNNKKKEEKEAEIESIVNIMNCVLL